MFTVLHVCSILGSTIGSPSTVSSISGSCSSSLFSVVVVDDTTPLRVVVAVDGIAIFVLTSFLP